MATVKTEKKNVTDRIEWEKRTLEDIPRDKLSLHYFSRKGTKGAKFLASLRLCAKSSFWDASQR
jgi:hypothetical protein